MGADQEYWRNYISHQARKHLGPGPGDNDVWDTLLDGSITGLMMRVVGYGL